MSATRSEDDSFSGVSAATATWRRSAHRGWAPSWETADLRRAVAEERELRLSGRSRRRGGAVPLGARPLLRVCCCAGGSGSGCLVLTITHW